MSLWLVRAGKHGQQEQLALENNLACIGFSEFPDLSKANTRKDIYRIAQEVVPDGPQNRWHNFTGQLNAFANRMQTGDLVVMPLKTTSQIAIGKVAGPYTYRTDLGEVHHTRSVDWQQSDIPRTKFGQDLLYSMGAFLTVCQISRNNAEERVQAILEGKPDPGWKATDGDDNGEDGDGETSHELDIEVIARDGIRKFVESNFKSHSLAHLVNAVLQAEGYVTQVSPPGADGGVDILARRGVLGFEGPKLCVQVKSSIDPAGVNILRELQGTMSNFKAEEGLLVCWGGFNRLVIKEARFSFFSVRLWDADELITAIERNYDRLPEELQAELPLKRIWAIVPEE